MSWPIGGSIESILVKGNKGVNNFVFPRADLNFVWCVWMGSTSPSLKNQQRSGHLSTGVEFWATFQFISCFTLRENIKSKLNLWRKVYIYIYGIHLGDAEIPPCHRNITPLVLQVDFLWGRYTLSWHSCLFFHACGGWSCVTQSSRRHRISGVNSFIPEWNYFPLTCACRISITPKHAQ